MDEYLKIISKGESETVEFKKSTASLRDATETLCAFANTKGGYLFFCVDDDGKILGQQVTDDTLKNISNAVQLNTEPKLYPTVEKITFEGKTCVAIVIEESPLKPHLAYGRPFKRVGASNHKIDRDGYEYLLQQRLNGYGFDYQIANKASIEDIDENKVLAFIEKANSLRNLNESLFLPIEVLLEKLGLIIEGQLTNAAILLFGKKPSKFFEGNFEIKCGLFNEDEGYDEILNHKEYNKSLLENFELVYSFILSSIKSSLLKEGAYSQEKYEFPTTVIRELLTNMIVHKNYREGIKNTVEIRPGFIQFQNPGTLFEPTITLEKLYRHHVSKPGNKLIAKVFYMSGLFENWGSGTLKVISQLKKEGKKEPEFLYDAGVFRVKMVRE